MSVSTVDDRLDLHLQSAAREEDPDGGGADEDDDLGEDFGQKIDLTVRIRQILLSYEHTSVVKELIQV